MMEHERRNELWDRGAEVAERDPAAAIALFEQAMAIEADPTLMVNIAMCHQRLGDSRSAERWFRELEPMLLADGWDDAFACNACAWHYYENAPDRLEVALKLVGKAIADEPHNPNFWDTEIRVLFALKRDDLALSLLARRFSRSPRLEILADLYRQHRAKIEQWLQNRDFDRELLELLEEDVEVDLLAFLCGTSEQFDHQSCDEEFDWLADQMLLELGLPDEHPLVARLIQAAFRAESLEQLFERLVLYLGREPKVADYHRILEAFLAAGLPPLDGVIAALAPVELEPEMIEAAQQLLLPQQHDAITARLTDEDDEFVVDLLSSILRKQ